MQRKKFIQTLALTGMAGAAMKLHELGKFTSQLDNTETMPVLFLGHGSPMNAIEENEFVKGFREAGKSIPKPRAVICVSAHWETRGTFITAMEKPPTIHDFGGFPRELFEVQYPAPGSPAIANETKELIKKTTVGLDQKWGLDHGCWSVVKHLYPAADVPVLQLSLDYTQPASYHYELAKELAALRRKGVLITGSGNLVHNLGMAAWDKMKADNYGYDWAIEASTKMKKFIEDGDHQSLINYRSQGRAFDLSIPSPEHFLPLLYILALKEKNEKISFFNDKAVAGSLTMTSVLVNS
ncbi:MAG: 4,5-DOPA dioxygenase extradiol [Bacteroidetes bacterium]|nr:4,5-DOPA dioxygenase extradiol [Bacteroidota bacterium]